MDSSPAESSAAAGHKKRKRVSRACDACFAKKDRCDGAQPICKVCKNLGRPCTYNRPERKRGPSQGVRQRLEGQIENLESMLGYMVDSYPQFCQEAIKHLRLEDAEANLVNSSQLFSNSLNTPSPSSSALTMAGNIYPRYSKMDARELWRLSTFAKAIAPSLGLDLGIEEEDEDGQGLDGMRARIEEARRARARLRNGINIDSPATAPVPHHYQHPHPHQHPHQHPPPHLPPYVSPTHAHMHPQHQQTVSHQQPLSASASQAHQHFSSAQHYPPSKKMQGRPSAGMAVQPGSGYGPEGAHLQAHSHPSQHPPPPHSSHPPTSHPSDAHYSSAPLFPRLDSYAPPPHPSSSTNTSHPHSNSFDGEADALAYALGLPAQGVYAHPPRPWMQGSTSSDQSGQGAFPPHQGATSSGHDDNASQSAAPALNFFSEEYEFDLANQQSNAHQMSILYQLGLQGSVDMATPASTANANGDPNQSSGGAAPVPGAVNSSASSHHTPTQWLQPIRGIN